jgi:hypothetical protein
MNLLLLFLIILAGLFVAKITSNRTCLVTLNNSLDYEKNKEWRFKVSLESLSGFVNPMKASTHVSL